MNSVIVQHCFGKPSTGGPVVAMERLLNRSSVPFVVIRQTEPAGGLSISLLLKFFRELKAARPVLIHVRGLGNEGFHAALAAKLAGVPNILVSVHGTHRDLQFSENRFKHWIVTNVLETLTLVMANYLATVCQYAAQRDFILRFKSKLIAVVPNGVDIPNLDITKDFLREEFCLPKNLLLAVTVSRITKEKGYIVLAEALHILDKLGVRFALLIVGGGDENGDIRAKFEGLNGITVRFVGHRTDVAKFLAGADFFVFPSLHENLSNALLEAMSYGLPVIATEAGGNTEILLKGGGLLVPPGKALPLATAIRHLLGDKELSRKLGTEAREVVRNFYSTEHMVNSWKCVYEKILGQKIAG